MFEEFHPKHKAITNNNPNPQTRRQNISEYKSFGTQLKR